METLSGKPSRVFYGWWIVGAGFFIAVYMSGAISHTFTALFKPLADEFGWSYTHISLAASLRSAESAIIAPLIGILVDRYGPRKMIFGGAIVAALGLMLFSRTNSLITFYAATALMAAGMSTTGVTVLMTAVANWFRRRVGIAAGIIGAGLGSGGLLVPIVVMLIDTYGWRNAMVIVTLGVLVIVLPLASIIRHKPEQYGYLPDGEVKRTVAEGKSSALAQTTEVEIGRRQALRSRTFWHIALALTAQSMVLQAVSIHVMPYLSSIGIARSMSSLVAGGIPFLSIGGRLNVGWLSEKFDRRRVMAVAFAMMSLGLLFFEYTPNVGAWLLVPFVILFGIGYGVNLTMRTVSVRTYFGRKNFGSIFGLVLGLMAVGGLVGAPLAGWVFDTRGSYQGFWLTMLVLTAAGMITMLTMPKVSTKVQTTDKVA